MVRIIHTADWHLGQTLHDHDRRYEHACFLRWLLEQLEETKADALIVAGDVFDVASPSSEAQAQYYGFLADCRRRLPDLDLIVVGGNHDSSARLDAPAQILGALDITVQGGLPLTDDYEVDLDRLVVPIRQQGEIAAWAILVPFVRRRELPAGADESFEEQDPLHKRLVGGYRELMRRLLAAAQSRREPGQPIIATGHCYIAGGATSDRSERRIQVGYQHALPVDVYPEELAYVALGHLHRAQEVYGHKNVRYSGSPIPLSLSEKDYQHQVVLVELENGAFVKAEPLAVPRAVDMLHLPEKHAPLAEVLAKLHSLGHTGQPVEQQPFIEVRVLLEKAQPRLRQDIEAALVGADARLLRIDVKRPEIEAEPTQARRSLDAIGPEDVFRAAYKAQREGEPPAELISRFAELLTEAS